MKIGMANNGRQQMNNGEEKLLTELSNTSSVNIVYDLEQHPDWLSAVTANQVAYMPHMSGDSEPEELARRLKALNSSKLLGEVNLRLTSITVVDHD